MPAKKSLKNEIVVVTPPPPLSPSLVELTGQAQGYMLAAKAPETVRKYRGDWKDFESWCSRNGRQALPASPETIALYITDASRTHKTSTIQRRMTSLSQAHLAAGHADSPCKTALVKSVWQGIRREKGVAREGKAPTLTADMIRMVHALDVGSLRGRRDRALLLVGFAGAFRRSELVALTLADIAFQEQGIIVTIRRSKTDQEGEGQKVGIPYGMMEETCPVRALADWLDAAGITEGPVFRGVDKFDTVAKHGLNDRTVARVVQSAIKRIGKDPKNFAGHSLRAGLATSAAMAGKSMRAIMGQTRHRSEAMVRVYIRDGSLFRDNAAQGIGL